MVRLIDVVFLLWYGCWMPFKHNACCRHHIPKMRRRVKNWPAYEAGLQRRSALIFWLDEMALTGWRARLRTI